MLKKFDFKFAAEAKNLKKIVDSGKVYNDTIDFILLMLFNILIPS